MMKLWNDSLEVTKYINIKKNIWNLTKVLPNIANKHETYLELKRKQTENEKKISVFFGENIRNANFTPNS